jgi:hypothetical protein
VSGEGVPPDPVASEGVESAEVGLLSTPVGAVAGDVQGTPAAAPPAKKAPAAAPPAKKALAAEPTARKALAAAPPAKKALAAEPTAKKALAAEPTAKKALAAEPTAKKAVDLDGKRSGASRSKRRRSGDPDAVDFVVDSARVKFRPNADGTRSVRFMARVRGGRGGSLNVFFNPPDSGWVQKSMRTEDDATFATSVVFREANLGEIYWYIEATRPDGKKAGWGSAADKKRIRID